MKKTYCDNCAKDVNYSIIKNVIKEFKGYEVNVLEKIGVCAQCQNNLYVTELETENFTRLYAKYRELAQIIGPDQLIDFREKYKLSQRELTSILNWGKMTINRYERGAMPSSSHNDLLKMLIVDESILKKKAEEAYQAGRITERTREKIKTNVLASYQDIF